MKQANDIHDILFYTAYTLILIQSGTL